MLRVALKGLAGHKIRFLLTTLAVVAGVTFVAGAYVLTDSIERAFGDLMETGFGEVDLYVTAPDGFESEDGTFAPPGPPEPFDAEVAETVEGVEGVELVDGIVETLEAVIVDPEGEPIIPQAPTLGYSWTDGPGLGPISLRDGRAPEAADEVTIDAGTFERHGFSLGDEVELLVPEGGISATLVGVTGYGEEDDLLGATLVTFELERARELFGATGAFTELSVVADEDTDPVALLDRLAAELGDEATVATADDRIADEQAVLDGFLDILTTALLVFGGIALFVGAFLVVNTFGIVVAQRAREFALLRAVGASRRQVTIAVLVEALAVGLVASALGLGLGVGLGVGLPALLAAGGIDLPTSGMVVTTRTVVASFAVGTLVTLAAAILPARRAARVAPVEALRGTAMAATSPLRRRSLTGGVFALVGGAALVAGLAGATPEPLAVVGFGAAFLFIGVTLLAPLLASPLARLIATLPARWSVSGALARGNAMRDPRRTASTASALMVGLALVSAVSIVAASVQSALGDTLDRQFRADLIVQADQMGMRDLPPRVADTLAADEAVGELAVLRTGQVEDDGAARTLFGVSAETIDGLLDLEVEEGAIADLADGGVALQTDIAADRDLDLGDELVVVTRRGEEVGLPVVATFGSADILGSGYLVGLDTLTELGGGDGALLILLDAADELEPAREVAEAAVADVAGASVEDQAAFRERQEAQIDGVLNLMIALLALAIVIALIGIANTLVLAIHERTREIGLLRAVGMDRPQTRRMILWEALIVAVFGGVLGAAVGTFLGWALVTALDDGVASVVIPGGQLAVYLLVAAVAGVIAAVLPAWRAARLDVLRAVTVE